MPTSALLVRCWDGGEASIIRQLLASYDIPCQIASSGPYTVLPFSLRGLGEIRILVSPSRIAEAKALLADHRRQGYRVIRGGRARRGGRRRAPRAGGHPGA